MSRYLVFVWKHCGGETISRPCLKKLKLSISLDQFSKVYIFCFNCLISLGVTKLIETKQQTICIQIKFFKKTKRSLKLVSLPHFLHDLWRQIFLLLFPFTWPNFNIWLALFTLWDIGQYVYYNSFLTRLWRKKCWD